MNKAIILQYATMVLVALTLLGVVVLVANQQKPVRPQIVVRDVMVTPSAVPTATPSAVMKVVPSVKR